MSRREVVTKALEQLGKASPKEKLRVAVRVSPSITSQLAREIIVQS